MKEIKRYNVFWLLVMIASGISALFLSPIIYSCVVKYPNSLLYNIISFWGWYMVTTKDPGGYYPHSVKDYIHGGTIGVSFLISLVIGLIIYFKVFKGTSSVEISLSSVWRNILLIIAIIFFIGFICFIFYVCYLGLHSG